MDYVLSSLASDWLSEIMCGEYWPLIGCSWMGHVDLVKTTPVL